MTPDAFNLIAFIVITCVLLKILSYCTGIDDLYCKRKTTKRLLTYAKKHSLRTGNWWRFFGSYDGDEIFNHLLNEAERGDNA